MKTYEILQAARDLITDPKNYAKYDYAKDLYGNAVSISSL